MKLQNRIGQASRLLLVLAIVVFVAVIITYLILRMANKPPAPTPNPDDVVPQQVFEKQLGDIDFIFKSAIDRGEVLKISEINTEIYGSYMKDIHVLPGGKFIQVTVGAKNMGTVNTERGAWDIGDIQDSKGRVYVPLIDYSIGAWLPATNGCGDLLKPAFSPTNCTKIYEVSTEATGLKINVKVGDDNSSSNLNSGKAQTFLLDIIVN